MEENHVIALCRWQTTFDQQTKAVELQNFISQWSNTVLEVELNQYFNHLCPSTRTWRINTLRLDLGDILLDDLPVELPRRLRASLREHFDRLLTQQQHGMESTDSRNVQILDQVESYREFVIWFLRHGTSPWWFQGRESVIEILDHQLQQDTQATIDIISDMGRLEVVRKRLVWQFGESRVRKVIHLLEPWRGDVICAFADNLFEVQVQQQIPTSDTADFRKVTWLTILTVLLIERGSFSNTLAFVYTNLKQIAQHYKIDFSDLIGQMFQAVSVLELKGEVDFNFFTVIKTIHQQGQEHFKARELDSDPTIDYWVQFQSLLQGGVKHKKNKKEIFKINELFIALAQQDSERMAQFLRQEGKAQRLQLNVLLAFTDQELALVVRVLEPQNYGFILAYIQYAQSLIELQGWDKKLVWREVLTFLLCKRGSSLDQRQVIDHSLAQMSKRQNFDYMQLLELFIYGAATPQLSQHQFELLTVFQDLRKKRIKQNALSNTQSLDWAKIRHYLQTGEQNPFWTDHIRHIQQAMFDRSFLDYTSQSVRDPIAQLLEAAESVEVNDASYSQRLLELVGAADFSKLLDVLEPEVSSFCLAFISHLLLWKRRGLLFCLDKIDLAFQLPAMLTQVLLSFYQNRPESHSVFSFNDFWRGFITLLRRQGGVDIDVFHQQLAYCLVHEPQGNSSASRAIKDSGLLLLIQDIIASEEHTRSSPTHTPSTSHELVISDTTAMASSPWSVTQLFHALRLYLMPKGLVVSGDIPQALLELPIEALWLQLDSGNVIAHWLDRQSDKPYLLHLLSRQRHIQPVQHWLLAQLPSEFNHPEETLKHLSILLLQSGCWQGASAVLEQHLVEVFWSVIFDAKSYELSASELLARIVLTACFRLNIRVSDCLDSSSQQTHLLEQTPWRNALRDSAKESKASMALEQPKTLSAAKCSTEGEEPSQTDFQQDFLAHYLNHPRIIEISRHLLQYGRPPSWLKSAQPIDITRLLFDLFTVHPDDVPELLSNFESQPAVVFRVLNIVPFAWLLNAIHVTAPNKQTSSTWLEAFYQCLTHIVMTDVSSQQRTAILFELVLQHWLKRQWVELEVENLVSRFFWQLMRRYPVQKSTLQQSFAPQMDKLPTLLKLTLIEVIADTADSDSTSHKEEYTQNKTLSKDKKIMAAIKAAQKPHSSTTPMAINNVGLVILQSFMVPFFSRLGLTQDNKFVTPSAQRRAVHYLQFLVTGCQETPEQFLILNKLLCGLAPYEPVEIGIALSQAEIEICHSLLLAVIEYWSAIGSSTVDGFRGNWLVRDGSLSDAKDHWHLIVEKRAYDLLLAKAPFSYAVIKLPWMEKAIYVTWPI